MRYSIIILLFTVFSISIHAQTHLELLVPLGTSNMTQASIDRVNGELPPNDIQWHSGFTKGVETRISVPLSQKLSLKVYINYLILQNNLSLVEERTSFSWIYRKVDARFNEHNIGMGLHIQFDLLEFGNHSISPFLRFGVNFVTYSDAITSEKRINFYPPYEQNYEGRISEMYQSDNYYYNPGVGLSYNFQVSDRFSFFTDIAYSYFYNEIYFESRSEIIPVDWHSYYAGIGARLDLITK